MARRLPLVLGIPIVAFALATAAQPGPAGADEVRTGPAAYGDWRTDAPGARVVKNRITMQLPAKRVELKPVR